MRDPKAEAARWLEQAESDLAFARYASDGGFYHQACFNGQQAAEKALKALHYAAGARAVLGHSVVGLLGRLVDTDPSLESLRDGAAELDLFYVPTRYPNGLAEGSPHRAFTAAQAERALAAAGAILREARARIGRIDNERTEGGHPPPEDTGHG